MKFLTEREIRSHIYIIEGRNAQNSRFLERGAKGGREAGCTGVATGFCSAERIGSAAAEPEGSASAGSPRLRRHGEEPPPARFLLYMRAPRDRLASPRGRFRPFGKILSLPPVPSCFRDGSPPLLSAIFYVRLHTHTFIY